jgi:hypothetical protein
MDSLNSPNAPRAIPRTVGIALSVFLGVCVDKSTDFKSPPMVLQLVKDFAHFEPLEPTLKLKPKI